MDQSVAIPHGALAPFTWVQEASGIDEADCGAILFFMLYHHQYFRQK